MSKAIDDKRSVILNRLCKWRAVFAGWMFGTKPNTDGPVRCFRDQMDDRLVSRVELSAVTNLLIDKGVFTYEELVNQLEIEANEMHVFLERKFDGARATSDGLAMDTQRFLETTKKLGFPP